MAYYIPPQGQPQASYPAPIVYYAAPPVAYQRVVALSYGLHFARQTSTILGALQIVLACISIAAGGMAISFEAGLWEIGTGFWCGMFYLIAGSIAIAAGRQATNPLIIATTVLSVFDILFGACEVSIASSGVQQYYYCSSYYNDDCESRRDAATAANSLMIGVGALTIIFGIWLMVISSRAIDKGNNMQFGTIPVAYAATQPEAVFIQAPVFQPQALQGYYGPLQYPPIPNSQQLQYPSIPNSQQMMDAGSQQTPSMTVKSDEQPPRY